MKRNLHVKKHRGSKPRAKKKPPVVSKAQPTNAAEFVKHIKSKNKAITKAELGLLHELCKQSMVPAFKVLEITKNKSITSLFNSLQTKIVSGCLTEILDKCKHYVGILDDFHDKYKDYKGSIKSAEYQLLTIELAFAYENWIHDFVTEVIDGPARKIFNTAGEVLSEEEINQLAKNINMPSEEESQKSIASIKKDRLSKAVDEATVGIDDYADELVVPVVVTPDIDSAKPLRGVSECIAYIDDSPFIPVQLPPDKHFV